VVRDYRSSEMLVGYASEIRQVLANLMLNAIDAAPEGGKIIARLEARNSLSGGGRRVLVTIADNGHGIPPEMRKKLFEPFVSTKGARGNGLGLWVSKGIVTKHGGRILMRSSTAGGRSGTVFSVVLPATGAAYVHGAAERVKQSSLT
jgi:signal transduction histidine kinase